MSPEANALLARYQAEPYSLEPLGAYERWALGFFVEPGNLLNPHLDTTLQLDVTDARARYEAEHASATGASFSAFLTWSLLDTLREHPAFNLRLVEGNWYLLRNPSLYFPVAVGGRQRFCDVLLDDVVGLAWSEFAARYRAGVERAMQGSFAPVSDLEFLLSTFVGNLPGLRFTGLTLHSVVHAHTKPFFYFGRRYYSAGGSAAGERLLVPFAAKLHHATSDLYVLDRLIQDLARRWGGD
ncbi:MAG: hypothetical protein HC927_11780 [Deltaproteobacteria bacterium]|nr:hypothetical protein [Deltaproteobacteria bacterium]